MNLIKRDPKNFNSAIKDSNGNVQFIQNEIIKDPELYTTLQVFQEKGEAELNVRIASTDDLLMGDRKYVRYMQTNLGRLITTATAEKLHVELWNSQFWWCPCIYS